MVEFFADTYALIEILKGNPNYEHYVWFLDLAHAERILYEDG
jgi:hypothetical protein